MFLSTYRIIVTTSKHNSLDLYTERIQNQNLCHNSEIRTPRWKLHQFSNLRVVIQLLLTNKCHPPYSKPPRRDLTICEPSFWDISTSSSRDLTRFFDQSALWLKKWHEPLAPKDVEIPQVSPITLSPQHYLPIRNNSSWEDLPPYLDYMNSESLPPACHSRIWCLTPNKKEIKSVSCTYHTHFALLKHPSPCDFGKRPQTNSEISNINIRESPSPTTTTHTQL
jgi:hypothetical protein